MAQITSLFDRPRQDEQILQGAGLKQEAPESTISAVLKGSMQQSLLSSTT